MVKAATIQIVKSSTLSGTMCRYWLIGLYKATYCSTSDRARPMYINTFLVLNSFQIGVRVARKAKTIPHCDTASVWNAMV